GVAIVDDDDATDMVPSFDASDMVPSFDATDDVHTSDLLPSDGVVFDGQAPFAPFPRSADPGLAGATAPAGAEADPSTDVATQRMVLEGPIDGADAAETTTRSRPAPPPFVPGTYVSAAPLPPVEPAAMNGPESTTPGGLKRRVRGQHLPDVERNPTPAPASPLSSRSPDEIRRALSSFQSGVARGREGRSGSEDEHDTQTEDAGIWSRRSNREGNGR
ncbi:MAG: hypothetical protein OEY23_18215, partial [Acidimicrobiia bacterium]|nr:hypothetical protein [Acidimicrobiia bacterium]